MHPPKQRPESQRERAKGNLRKDQMGDQILAAITVKFAIKMNALSEEEIKAIRNGNACMHDAGVFMPLNMDQPYQNGEKIKIYRNRRDDLLIEKLIN